MIFRIKLIQLLLIWGIFAAYPSYTQTYKPDFKNVKIDYGIITRQITAVVKDKRGYLWFGTNDGLLKYDGYNFNVYKNAPYDSLSLSSNNISCLYESSSGKLWIGTFFGGLNMFDPANGKFTRYLNDNNNDNLFLYHFINSIGEDAEGQIWISIIGKGIYRINPSTKKIQLFKHDPKDSTSVSENSANCMLKDRDGNLWLGASNWLEKFDLKSQTFKHFNGGAKISNITSLASCKDSTLWIGTRSGLIKFDPRTNHVIKHYLNNPSEQESIASNYIISLVLDKDENLIIGYDHQKVDRLIISNEKFIHYVLGPEKFESEREQGEVYILLDAEETIWACAYPSGISKLVPQYKNFQQYLEHKEKIIFNNQKISSIYEDRTGNIWYGDNSGLNILKDSEGKLFFKPSGFNPLNENRLTTITGDNHGFLWLASGTGIIRFDPKTKTYKDFKHDGQNGPSTNFIWTLSSDKKGNIWVGTGGEGLDMIEVDNNFKFHHYKSNGEKNNQLSGNYIGPVYEDRKGYIWVGPFGKGADRFDPKTQNFKHFSHSERDTNSVISNVVVVFFEDHKGRLWLETTNGLDLFDRETETFKHINVSKGATISGILEDEKGNLWISTGYGLIQFNPENGSAHTFDISDGLQSNIFMMGDFIKDKEGKMYFVTINGITVFDPKEINLNKYIPTIIIKDFRLFNKKVLPGENSPLTKDIEEAKEINLTHKQNFFEFEFCALSFINPEKNQYAYMLEGFDKNWNYVGTKRTATYTNIEPGEYIFKVKGSNNDGIWNENGTSIKIHIQPAFWQTSWFKILCIVLICLVVFLLFKVRTEQIKKYNKYLEETIQERTSALARSNQQERESRLLSEAARKDAETARAEAEKANQAKSLFLANMSHEIRTPMNGVMGMAELLSHTKLSEEQKEFTEIIKSSSENLLYVINNILDFSKIESGKIEIDEHKFDLVKCIEDILDLFGVKAGSMGIDLGYIIKNDVPTQLKGDSTKLRQVLINLLGNALKFTEKGEVFLKVSKVNSSGENIELEFMIKDTGIGIPKDKQSKLYNSFTQVDSSTTRKYGGTGLGLAISYKLVEILGGQLRLESNPGEGSTFYFNIKLKAAPDTIKNYPFTEPELVSKKLLLVDDNRTNLTILIHLMDRWKIQYSVASSAYEALNILEKEKDFNLIITDMQMPEMDGAEFANRIKELYKNTYPIILLTSLGDFNTIKNPDNIFSSILTKPVKQNVLLSTIKKELKNDKHTVNKESQKMIKKLSEKYPLNILVAEDNLTNQKLALYSLNSLGYHIDLAANGLEVLSALNIKSYDLILMDVQMPEMDGIECTKKICSMFSKELRPSIIAMTANAMEGDKEICLAAGMDDYVSKPFKIAELSKAIENVARKKESS